MTHDNNNSTPPEVEAMTEATMVGALMQCVVEQLKVLPKPWQALGEREQQEFLDRVQGQVEGAVKKAVFLLAAQDRVVIPATVNKVVFKDGVKAELELAPGAPGRHDLADAEGELVYILIGDNTALESRAGRPKAEKDQRDLPLNDINDDDADPTDEDNGAPKLALDGLEQLPRAERDALIKRATDLVVSSQVASVSLLAQQLDVSEHVAGQILAVLAEGGVVSAPNHEGLRRVLVVDGEVSESQQQTEEGEADDETDAAA